MLTVLIVAWSKISNFGVGWPKPNSGDGLMAKNGLLPYC
jgi:hypothetical protein